MVINLYNIRVAVWESRHSAEPFVCLRWTGLRIDQMYRFDWYFKLRAAQLRIKHPRAHHTFDALRYDATGVPLHLIRKKELQKKREQFSKMSNRLKSHFLEWKAIDPLGLSPFHELPEYPIVLARLREILEEIQVLEDLTSGQ